MSHRKTRHLFLAVCAVAYTAMLACARADAQEPTAINVSFTFSNATARSLQEQPEVTEAKISNSLANRFAARIRLWRFQANSAASFPQLRIWLDKTSDWVIRVALVRRQGAAEEGNWEVLLYGDVDTGIRGGLSPAEKWAKEIEKALDNWLFSKTADVVSILQQAIPLGTDVVPVASGPPDNADKARAVLPLDWQKYGASHGACAFRIRYRRTNGDLVVLHSKGICSPFDYKPDNHQYLGITVKHSRWEDEDISTHLTDLPDLTPIDFYLETPNEDDCLSVVR